MRTQTFGSGEDLLFLMGWGNRLDGENERWFVDRLVDAGYRVHAVEFPTDITSFETECLDPVREFRLENALQLAPVVSHSIGGLVSAYIQPEGTVYMSPLWGFHGEPGGEKTLGLLSKLPTNKKVLPHTIGRTDIGGLVTDSQWERMPDRASPTFVREVQSAQESMPSPRADARVLCSLNDTVVDLRTIGAHVDADQVTLYEGRHELFSSEGREKHVRKVIDAVRDVKPATLAG